MTPQATGERSLPRTSRIPYPVVREPGSIPRMRRRGDIIDRGLSGTRARDVDRSCWPGTHSDAGGSAERPVERGCGSSERNGSERAKVASVAEGNPPASRGPSGSQGGLLPQPRRGHSSTQGAFHLPHVRVGVELPPKSPVVHVPDGPEHLSLPPGPVMLPETPGDASSTGTTTSLPPWRRRY